MSEKQTKSKWLPPHLSSLLNDLQSQTTNDAVAQNLNQEGKTLSTSRVGRALKMSKFAVGNGGRWLLDKARDKISNDAEASQQRNEKRGLQVATQMLQTFAEMRGAAMKVGQMLSYVDDLLPPEGKKVLALLQRDAPPMSWDKVQHQFVRDFGKPPEELFASIEKEPIAAASIGQVHRATLPDGTPVAVKVQYPGIREAMEADLKNAKFLGLFQQVFFFRTDTKAIMKEIQERLLDECDYRKEATYQKVFAQRFADHPSIVIPHVHDSWSSQHVLTTTYHEGLGFYEWLATNPSKEERDHITRQFYRFYIGSFYLDGLFNCDPHPGNYLFLEDGRIVFFDYGCTRQFDEERRQLWLRMCKAVIEKDTDTLHKLSVPIGFFPENLNYHHEAFEELIHYLYHPYLEDTPFDFRQHPPRTTFRLMFTENPNLFKLNMPADAVFLNRIGFGLVSLLSEIGSTLNCYQYALQYFSRKDPDWDADPFIATPFPGTPLFSKPHAS